MTRREIAHLLKDASISYLLKKGYSCFTELGLTSWGKMRGDVVAINLRSHILLFEVKSSVSDYVTDSKWMNYKVHSNKMYFVFTFPVYEKLKERLKTDLKGSGVGVLVLCPVSGYLQVRASARATLMKRGIKRSMITRMAWRGGVSKRTNRRKRLYLT